MIAVYAAVGVILGLQVGKFLIAVMQLTGRVDRSLRADAWFEMSCDATSIVLTIFVLRQLGVW